MKNTSSATAPTEDGAVYHLRLKKDDVPGYVLLPGAPERTLIIAKNWDSYEEVAQYREYKTIKGLYKGVPIATTSTGVGSPSSEIAIHELNVLGVHTCIRVGTTGCIVPDYNLGDLIIPVAAVRKDGTTQSYIEPEYPAFANIEVVLALIEACKRLGYKYGLGLGYTVGSFYLGQGRPLSEGGYWPSWADNIIYDLQQARVTNIDMETAAHYVLGYLHDMRMGCILSVVANRVHNTFGDNGGEEKACRAASEAIKILTEWDAQKTQNV